MDAAELILIAASLALVAAVAPAVVRLRALLGKSRAAAASFAAPALVLGAPAVWLLARGELPAAAPLLSLVAACAGAAAIFAPTAATRFAAFERSFWAYVDQRD